MGKFSDMISQQISREAGKAAADFVRGQKDGARAYRVGGFIIFGCGIVWMLLSLIPMLCKNPLREWAWMLVLASIHIVLGLTLAILSKKSKRFQEWAAKDFSKSLNEQEKFKKKVQVGKKTLPITHGDIFALKVLGVLALILLIILGIGYLQGWVN